jgi:hypothetical protein
MVKNEENANTQQSYTKDELNIIAEISAGLKENGWLLEYIEKRGKGWAFYIEPIESTEHVKVTNEK